MGECICSSCKNLKGIIGENGGVEGYDCTFGFPSDECGECDGAECSILAECGNYVEDMGEEALITVKCRDCGKELTKAADDGDDEVLCIDCYLKQI